MVSFGSHGDSSTSANKQHQGLFLPVHMEGGRVNSEVLFSAWLRITAAGMRQYADFAEVWMDQAVSHHSYAQSEQKNKERM
ncbi:unnamed protein product [Knipowitschia caucasica]